MKIHKQLLRGVFWLLILTLLVSPLALIWKISEHEMAAYTAPDVPKLMETAIGDAIQATRQDVKEYVILSGRFISEDYDYMELNRKHVSDIRWLVDLGDEIQEGQVVGTYKTQDITSTVTGILTEINTYSSAPHLKVQTFDPILLETKVTDRTLAAIAGGDSLVTEAGEEATIHFCSKQKNTDGTTTILLSIDSAQYTFGQEINALRLYTGRVYSRTLVLPEKCVYQKESGEGQPWFVRMVDEKGLFLSEIQVQIGYSNGEVVCVSGIEEGAWFDSGYKAVMGS